MNIIHRSKPQTGRPSPAPGRIARTAYRLALLASLMVGLALPSAGAQQTSQQPEIRRQPQPAQPAQQQPAQPPQPQSAQPGQAAQQQAQPVVLEPDAVIEHLSTAIAWYRRIVTMDVGAGRPSDALYLQNARAQALQALEAAFSSAREVMDLLGRDRPTATAEMTPEQKARGERSIKAAADVAARIAQTRTRIEALDRSIRSARGKKLKSLTIERDTLKSELELETTLQEGLGKMSAFMSSSENTGLAGRISFLKTSVPELAETKASDQKASAPKPVKSGEDYSPGLIGQTSLLLSQIGDVRAINDLLSETARLRATAVGLQRPLREYLRSLLKEGRDAVNQPAEASRTGDTRKALEAITAQFKQVSQASFPLRQEIVLLDQVRANLLEWRKSVEKEYGAILWSLLMRVLVILVALGVVLLLSEIWRRTTQRYVREVRRRRQLLLLRRFVTATSMVVVIILGFISEFSSLATFAGFLTAGIAVALQTVILSVAAYFFLIGRYGVRVGDRITVSGVTGDVINIGLVRLHLLELAGTGINLYPTGRVVSFSNSVLFQAAPLYKQIPGTTYTWHEAVVTLLPDADRTLVERKLLGAVNDVYGQYRHEIERQHGAVERTIDAEVTLPAPVGQVQYGEAGLEFVARYPAEIGRASEIDNQVAARLVEVISHDEELTRVVQGTPRLRSVIKG